MAIASFAACSDDTPQEHIADNELKVNLTLSIDDELTRASDGWDDYSPTDNGTVAENAINPGDLHIKVCDAAGRVIGSVGDVRITRVARNQYTATGLWLNPGQQLRNAKKIMIMANCGNEADNTDIANISYSIDGLNGYIPMWGVASISSLALGTSNDIGTISLLRATAKVGVELRSDMESRGYAIGALRIEGYNTMGYTLPTGYNRVASTESLRFEGSLHPLESAATAPLDFTQQHYCYLPEYDNTSSTATPSAIVVDLLRNGTHEGTYRLCFGTYQEGSPTGTLYDIQRNHYYKYTIYKEDDHVMVSLHVRKWYYRQHDDIIM